MNLIQFLRMDINNKWISLIKKDMCEVCSTKENLEVHHEIQFIELLNDVLKLLNLKYKEDINNYSVEELEKIRLILLGKHLDIKGITICQECHDNEHIIKNLFKTMKKLNQAKLYKNDIILLNNKLKELKGGKLFNGNKEEFKLFLKSLIAFQFKINHNSLGYKIINSKLEELCIPYYIISKKENSKKSEFRGKYYWTILKI